MRTIFHQVVQVWFLRAYLIVPNISITLKAKKINISQALLVSVRVLEECLDLEAM